MRAGDNDACDGGADDRVDDDDAYVNMMKTCN